MAKYQVLVPSVIDGRLYEQSDIDKAGPDGLIVDYDGVASWNLKFVGDEREEKAHKTKTKSALLKEARSVGAVVNVKGKNGEDPTTRELTEDDTVETISRALADYQQSKIA